MSYGTPVENQDNAVYEIEILDSEGRGLTFRAESGGWGASVYEPLFQEIVTTIDGSSALTLSYAKRDYPTGQPVTP